MGIFLWVLQALLAVHTAMGAFWKFSHSPEQTMPSLKALPSGLWMVMAVVELACAVALLLPAVKQPLAIGAPIAAVVIVAEMLLFTGLHFSGGSAELGPAVYWLVVAAACAFVAYGRFVLKPL